MEKRDWIRIDWHHHTHDDPNRHETMSKDDEVIRKALVKFHKNDGGIIAITNHNTCSEESIAQYTRILKDERLLEKVAIIPGMETEVQISDEDHLVIHLIYIFSSLEASKAAKKALDGIVKSGNEKVTIEQSIEAVSKAVRDENSEFIACPHYLKEHKGLKSRNAGTIPEYILHAFDILEVTRRSENSKTFICAMKQYAEKTMKEVEDVPHAHGTDAHYYNSDLPSAKCFEKEMMNLKFFNTERSFRGLKLAIRHFRFRCFRGVSKPDTIPNLLESISLVSKEERVFFQPGLNVIVGERGSGKSVLLYKIAESLGANIPPSNDWTRLLKKYGKTPLEIAHQWSGVLHSNNVFYLPQNHLTTLIENTKRSLDNDVKNLENESHSYRNIVSFMNEALPVDKLCQSANAFVINREKLVNQMVAWIQSATMMKKEVGKKRDDMQRGLYKDVSDLTRPEKYEPYKKKLKQEKVFINAFEAVYKDLFLNKEWLFDSELRAQIVNLSKAISSYFQVTVDAHDKKVLMLEKIYSGSLEIAATIPISASDKNMEIASDAPSNIASIINSTKDTLKGMRMTLENSYSHWKKIRNGFQRSEPSEIQVGGIGPSYIRSIYYCRLRNEETWSELLSRAFMECLDRKSETAEKIFRDPLDRQTPYWKKQDARMTRDMNRYFELSRTLEIKRDERLFPYEEGDDENEEFIDMQRLSPGQQQYTFLRHILNTIMVNKRNILLIDQPEDDLDAKAVEKGVIDALTIFKDEVQIILATHDPKIAINSDPKVLVICNFADKKKKNYRNMDFSSTRDWEEVSGLVDAKREYPFKRYVHYKEIRDMTASEENK